MEISVAWPMRRGRVHHVRHQSADCGVETTCGRRVVTKTDAWMGEPGFSVRTRTFAEFVKDPDSCQQCKNSMPVEVIREGWGI